MLLEVKNAILVQNLGKKNVTALEIDPLPGCLSSNQDLDISIFELLLSVKSGAGLVPETGFHASMNASDLKAPLF